MMIAQDARLLIIGGGESGVGAALLAKKKNLSVFLSEFGKLSEKHKKELIDNKVPFEEEGHTLEKIENFDLVIKSPGVPHGAAPLRIAKEKEILVISEIELGYHFYSGSLMSVTGSNGKTTTSGLLFHLLKTAGYDVAIGGNYGTSFCRILAEVETEPAWMVLELSSFQLDDIVSFRSEIAILLNITADHLDRYEYDIRKYGEAKFNIIKNQQQEDLFIFNADDFWTINLSKGKTLHMNCLGLSLKDYKSGIYSKELNAFFDIKLYGKHNLFNARCAIEAARHVGISDTTIGLGLKSFTNIPHRMETVAVINGITYINDSKATNVDAVFYAVDGIKQRIIWIAGGTDKGNDYAPLQRLVAEKVKAIICLGVDNRKLFEAFHSSVDKMFATQKVNEAVTLSTKLAKQGEVVLLSPACASFDLFRNYEDRGNRFKKSVFNLLD